MNVIEQCCQVLGRVDPYQILKTLAELEMLRERKGRLFLIGNGGGAGHASHAVGDFRKLAHIEAHAWGDSVTDMTAWINDESWEVSVACWLASLNYTRDDCLFFFTVGGSSDTTSANLKWAMSTAWGGPPILGICGAAGGELARYGAPIIVPSFSTPVIEGCQSVIAHHLVEELCA